MAAGIDHFLSGWSEVFYFLFLVKTPPGLISRARARANNFRVRGWREQNNFHSEFNTLRELILPESRRRANTVRALAYLLMDEAPIPRDRSRERLLRDTERDATDGPQG